jgi:hypothetical protein
LFDPCSIPSPSCCRGSLAFLDHSRQAAAIKQVDINTMTGRLPRERDVPRERDRAARMLACGWRRAE